MNTIFRTIAGSHLYGTSTPKSDKDVKEVFVPSRKSLLIQKVQTVVRTGTSPDTVKNGADDLDVEAFAFHRFIHLLCQGQLVAIDLIFATTTACAELVTPAWQEVYENRELFLNRQAEPMLGYCRQQASKYGVKAARVNTTKAALALFTELLNKHGTTAKVGLVEDELLAFVEAHPEFAKIEDKTMPNGTTIRHINVCDRMVPFTATIKLAHGVYDALDKEYGKRAVLAASKENIDWKALSHALRVGYQSVEFLRNGKVTLPLSNAQYLLDVKLGKVPVDTVSAEIDTLHAAVEEAAANSPLPERHNEEAVDEFVYRFYEKYAV